MVPSDVYEWGLSDRAREVFIFLCKRADNDDGTSFPGQKEIAEKCGYKSTVTVYRAIKELKEIGLITVEPRFEKGHQKSNLYTVFDSPGEALKTPDKPLRDNRTNVAPLSPVQPLPPVSVNTLPGDTVNALHPSPVHDRTISFELDSFNYEGGTASPIDGNAAEPTPEMYKYGDDFQLVELKPGQYELLKDMFGVETTFEYVKRLDLHLASTGKRYKSHYATIYKWITEDQRKAKKEPTSNRFNNFNQRNIDFDAYEKKERELRDKRARL